MKHHILLLVLLPLLAVGCKSISSLQDEAAILSGAIVRSARDTLTNGESRARLALLVDSLVGQAGIAFNRNLGGTRDSLLNDRTREWLVALEREILGDVERTSGNLREDILGSRTRGLIAAIRSELLGPNTQRLVGDLRSDLLGPETAILLRDLRDTILSAATLSYLETVRNSLLGDSTRVRLGALREELIGAGTRGSIDSIVASSLRRLQLASAEEQGRLTGNATTLFWTAGGVIALLLVLAGFIFMRNRRYQKMLEVLTYQIDRIPDPKAHAELTGRIKDQSKEIGIEPQLRGFLVKRGILKEQPPVGGVPDPAVA